MDERWAQQDELLPQQYWVLWRGSPSRHLVFGWWMGPLRIKICVETWLEWPLIIGLNQCIPSLFLALIAVAKSSSELQFEPEPTRTEPQVLL
jgi:hypothetical protein